MRLLSANLRNYRIHRDLTVEFDRERTLIGGPNESGKSTLVEAVHRALFLRAKGTGGPHQAMKPLQGGHPEVELRFEAGGARYHLVKRFSGQSGTTSLTCAGRPALAGEAAEAELARLLGVDCEASAKAACEHWAHLWVWQGQSSADPSDHANLQRDTLVQRLGQAGGAANLMQSERDSRVAAAFAASAAAVFKQGDKARADSELARAEAEEANAAASQTAALAQLQKLRQALTDHAAASSALATLQSDLANLTRESVEAETKAARLAGLRQTFSQQEAACAAATAAVKARQQGHDDIRALRDKIASGDAELAPLSAEIERLTRAAESARSQANAALTAYDLASDAVRLARQRQEFAAAQQSLFAAQTRRTEAEARAAQAREATAAVRKLEERLTALPALDSSLLKRIQSLDADRAAADAALSATAAGVDVLASPDAVSLGDRPLKPGDSRVVTEQTELTVGATRLRIRPGGGTRLADARRAVQDAASELRKLLDSVGVADVPAAVELSRRRNELAIQHRAEKAHLDELGAAGAEKKLRDAESDCVAAESELTRRAAALGTGASAAREPADAQRALLAATETLREAEAAEARARTVREQAARKAAEAEAELAALRVAGDARQRSVADLRAQQRLLEQQHGTEEERSAGLAAARQAETLAAQALAQTREAIAAEQPELLGPTQARLKRALEEAHRRRQEAEQRKAVADYTLRADGTLNPEENVSMASARLAAARERLASVRRQARAVQLLDELFRAEKQSLATQFTRPLVERVCTYLQALYGPGAQAEVAFDGQSFSPLRLIRPDVEGGTAIAFDKLSGGTREQVASAMRLAMAEVLAASHDGTLPLVLDDAFANADPERVRLLQRMLDLAAARGLQIIVVTCTPSDYATLGAKTISLERPAQVSA